MPINKITGTKSCRYVVRYTGLRFINVIKFGRTTPAALLLMYDTGHISVFIDEFREDGSSYAFSNNWEVINRRILIEKAGFVI